MLQEINLNFLNPHWTHNKMKKNNFQHNSIEKNT